jgi:hypothetical protein
VDWLNSSIESDMLLAYKHYRKSPLLFISAELAVYFALPSGNCFEHCCIAFALLFGRGSPPVCQLGYSTLLAMLKRVREATGLTGKERCVFSSGGPSRKCDVSSGEVLHLAQDSGMHSRPPSASYIEQSIWIGGGRL